MFVNVCTGALQAAFMVLSCLFGVGYCVLVCLFVGHSLLAPGVGTEHFFLIIMCVRNIAHRFVTFASEVDAKTALFAIQGCKFENKPIRARLKTESALKSFYRYDSACILSVHFWRYFRSVRYFYCYETCPGACLCCVQPFIVFVNVCHFTALRTAPSLRAKQEHPSPHRTALLVMLGLPSSPTTLRPTAPPVVPSMAR